jgi:hypothetical protein
MPTQPRASFLRSLPLVALALASVTKAQAPAASPTPFSTAAAASPSLIIQSPTSGETAQGVTIIGLRTENVRLASLFVPNDQQLGQRPVAPRLRWAIRVPSDAPDSTARPSVLSRFEFVVSSGALLPTGDQRDALKRAKMTIAQLSYAVRPYLAVTTSMGWARSRDIAVVDAPKLDVFTYDVGAELRADRWLSGKALTFTPFAGAGAGGRSYNYRSLEVDATHNLAAYGSAGAELGYRRIRFRVEARDYVTGFKPLTGNGVSENRNDVSVMAGFRITAH